MIFTEYINCRFIAVVGFCDSALHGGTLPSAVRGILMAETEDCIVVNVLDGGRGVTRELSGLTYINKKYLIVINFQ